MTKYLSPRTDISFKKLFANEHNKNLTIHFLNSILNLSGNREINDIVLRETVNLPDRAQGKEIIFDVYCTDTKNNHFIIEMQAVNEYNFHERAQYYAARILANQLKSSDNYVDLLPVIFVGVVDYSLELIKKYKRHHSLRNDSIIALEQSILESDDVITKYSFVNQKTQQIIPVPLIELNFVELPKFKKSLEYCITPVDQWLYLMTQIDSCQEIPESIKKVPFLVQAFDSLEQKKWNKAELERYVEEQEAMGKEDRIAQGNFEEGVQQKAIEIAIKLLKKNMSYEDISEITNLNITEIENIAISIMEKI